MSRKNRVILIGIDGASLPVTRRYLEHLPNIKRIINKGHARTMLSPMPITPAAWTSIATGTDPTEHGVVDFVYMKPGHEVGLVNRTLRKRSAIWNTLSEKGYKCIIINYPITYPPEKINGLMVSGFLTPDTGSDFVHPKSKKEKIMSYCKEYRIFIREPFTGDGKKFVRDIIEVDSSKGDIALRSMDDMDWDFLALAFMGLDHVQHMFWHQIDKRHPRHEPAKEDPILKVYKNIDAYLGKIMLKAPDAPVVIVSDHGFGPLHYYVDMNRFLGRRGYLKYPFSLFKKQQGWEDIDWNKTKAYSLGYLSPVSLNREGIKDEGKTQGFIVKDLRTSGIPKKARRYWTRCTGLRMLAQALTEKGCPT